MSHSLVSTLRLKQLLYVLYCFCLIRLGWSSHAYFFRQKLLGETTYNLTSKSAGMEDPTSAGAISDSKNMETREIFTPTEALELATRKPSRIPYILDQFFSAPWGVNFDKVSFEKLLREFEQNSPEEFLQYFRDKNKIDVVLDFMLRSGSTTLVKAAFQSGIKDLNEMNSATRNQMFATLARLPLSERLELQKQNPRYNYEFAAISHLLGENTSKFQGVVAPGLFNSVASSLPTQVMIGASAQLDAGNHALLRQFCELHLNYEHPHLHLLGTIMASSNELIPMDLRALYYERARQYYSDGWVKEWLAKLPESLRRSLESN